MSANRRRDNNWPIFRRCCAIPWASPERITKTACESRGSNRKIAYYRRLSDAIRSVQRCRCIAFATSFDKNCNASSLAADRPASESFARNIDRRIISAPRELGAPGERFLQRVRSAARYCFGRQSGRSRSRWNYATNIPKRGRMVLQDRSAGATVVAVVGATGQGKSWLIRQLVRQVLGGQVDSQRQQRRRSD